MTEKPYSENRIMLTLMFNAIRVDMAGSNARARYLGVAEAAAREEFWKFRERGVNPRESAELGFEAAWQVIPHGLVPAISARSE